MPHSFGYRAGTRHLFSRDFRKRGKLPTGTYLQGYHVGDLVDISVNGNIHKGLPYKYYQGKTGRIWNVTPRSVGVEIGKQVGNRIMVKRLHVRIEHIKPSKSREGFLSRVKKNDALRAQYKKEKKVVDFPLKRTNEGPRNGFHVSTKGKTIEDLHPAPYTAPFN